MYINNMYIQNCSWNVLENKIMCTILENLSFSIFHQQYRTKEAKEPSKII